MEQNTKKRVVKVLRKLPAKPKASVDKEPIDSAHLHFKITPEVISKFKGASPDQLIKGLSNFLTLAIHTATEDGNIYIGSKEEVFSLNLKELGNM